MENDNNQNYTWSERAGWRDGEREMERERRVKGGGGGSAIKTPVEL